MDKELYQETFGKLRASQEAKQEVLMKVKHKKAVWKTAVLAAVMALALAVTAGAVNLATEGMLMGTLRQLWTDGVVTRYQVEDGAGGIIDVTVTENGEENGDVSYSVGETIPSAGGVTITVGE